MAKFVPAACAALLLLSTVQAGTIYYIDDSSNSLRTMDPNTYATALVGATGVGGDFGDLAYNSATGTLFWAPGRGNDNLYTLNMATGAATLVGAHGVSDLFGLAYDPLTGMLYGQSSSSSFYSLDMNAGAATLIGSNSVYPGGLTYNGTLGALVLSSAGTGDFYTVNPASGAATLLSVGSGFLNDNGLAYDPDRDIYWTNDWSGFVYQYDANTFARSAVLSEQGALDGIVYIAGAAQVPEPSTMGLIAGGGALLFLRRRR